jgi:hypothetical protein
MAPLEGIGARHRCMLSGLYFLLGDRMQNESGSFTLSGSEMKKIVIISLGACIAFDLFVAWMVLG